MAELIQDNVTGLVLAGGRARRMGGIDKGLAQVAGRPMIEWVLDGLRPQTAALLINANRSHATYRAYGHPVIADKLGGYCGPLAGMASGLEACTTDYLATCPCDSPLLPPDLVARLQRDLQAQQAELAVAHNGERLQPVFALLSRELLPSLNAFLANDGRKIDQWYAQHRMATVDFSDRPEAFLNINSADDASALADRLQAASP
ncbi:molybdopterin-guanine dinucleotide biosynthesis protein A [Methylohalomonas lacus]|uniref:Molybdenum cofactor guanylyltransferase n=1 Tax=Methylohalomonas lacus TaxID=398773 RepID=A0AAE3HHT6_9GAMM|nr:molybdenum cofactor guanylyltransferase MobA [Methylohalomonas lacus]MCS3902601.1 molybdopterin-guanine dinucleotide biosynthesis protein A [Methylohalomonas lacus]